MRCLLTTVGSRGDVQPMLVLGAELVRRGHAVTIAAPPNFRDSVESEGLPFWPIGEDTARLIEENKELSERSPITSLPAQIAILKRETERQLDELLAYPEGADVIVAAGLSFGARVLAEKRGARYAYVCYSLAGLRSAAHPPAPLPLFGLPRFANRGLWAVAVGLFDRAIAPVIERERERQGLGPAPAWTSIHASRTLLAQDALFGDLPADAAGCRERAPALVRVNAPAPLPSDVERFLVESADDHPLVYVGFGSMPTVDRERLVATLTEVHAATRARIALFSPGEMSSPASDGIFALPSLDHRALFPRMQLVVHHGGAGTTATALRAGVPQLIIPHILDQFFHGRRVHELGLGPRPINKAKLDARGLIAAIEEQARYRERARAVGSELAGTTGAPGTAEFLERPPLDSR